MNIETVAHARSITGAIVSAYVAHNPISPRDLTGLINDTFAAIIALGEDAPEPVKLTPALPKSHIVQSHSIGCLECGKRFRSIKRHLMTHHNLTPDQYRKRWELTEAQGAMVAPDYSKVRSQLAKATKLGHKKR